MEAIRGGCDHRSLEVASEFNEGTDADLRTILKGELEPGERILWAGRSEPVAEIFGLGFYLLSALAMILLLLSVVGIGSFLDARRHRHFLDESSIGVGLLFLGVACVIVIGLIAYWNSLRREFRRKANILYAVTDRRAIVRTPEPKSDAIRIKTVDRGQIQTLERVQRPNGSGDLIFSTWKGHALPDPDYDYGWYSFGFRDIHDVRRVEQIVRHNLVSNERMT